MGSASAEPRQPNSQIPEHLLRNQLHKILASEIFSRSGRLCAFLRFVVDETLAGRGETLKEQVLAAEVYGRASGLTGDDDSMVRVDARRVRDKLREFYAASRDEPVIISIPKGSYTPIFERSEARAAGSAISADDVHDHLERILPTPGFRSSDSLRRFLRYTVEETLAGRGDQLKEYTIGVEALGRDPAFDPHRDTIVRVQARKLRERLAAYYAGEGRHEKWRIVYQPGSYAPSFTTLQQGPSSSGRTIAVLPFTNLTADHSAGYFCDGLAEELIDLLARTDGLRVVARTSSFQFKGVSADIREIGRRLGADLLVEGAVRNVGDRYRITVRLLSSADGCEVWAGRYDRTVQDVLELEAEVAAAIAHSLTSGSPPVNVASDTEGVTLYLKARYAWNRRSADGFRQALDLYSAAVRRDPRAAKAWAGISECHVLMMMHGLALPHVCMPEARKAALAGIAVDKGLASAASALAAVTALYDRDFQSAEDQWLRALATDPGYATAHHWYSMFGLVAMRRIDEALDQIREAELLDPLSAPIANDVGFVLYWSRRYDEARAQILKTIALNPAFYRAYSLLGRIHAAQGRYAESIAACLKARELSDGVAFSPFLLGTLGFAYGSDGNPAAARKVLQELRELEARGAVTAHERAIVACGLGEWDDAARAVEMADDQRTGWAVWFPIEPLLDSLRERASSPLLRSRERSRVDLP
jgi:serine/threonine-protein kinase